MCPHPGGRQEETDMENALNQLNDKQREAATVCDRNVRVVAGAGSGKTRMLMARIQYLIQDIGEDPSHILAITFTNKAANEMKERLEKILPDQARRVWISTIHSLCMRILREDAAALGYPKSFAVLDAEDQKSLMSRLLKEGGWDRKIIRPAAVLSVISKWKTKGISPAKARILPALDDVSEAAGRLYGRYEQEKQQMKAMDFDDLLVEADRLLKQDEQVRNKWQRRFDFLHVDEFQDIDPIQYDIIRNLTRKDAVLCVVGDPDQTIYTWRGAAMKILLYFDQDFSPCHTVIMDQNYRSTPSILNASNALIAQNKNRIKKNLYSAQKDLGPITLYEGISKEMEAQYIALSIQTLHEKKGVPLSEIAVLYRSNYLSRYLEQALRSRSIPYRIFGGIRFYERQEVKDVLSYLRLLRKPDETDPDQRGLDLYIDRVINVPQRAIGPTTMERVHAEAASRGLSLFSVIGDPQTIPAAAARKLKKFHDLILAMRKEAEKLELPELVDLVLEQTGYGEMLEEQNEEDRQENVQEIISDMISQRTQNPDLTLEDYLQNVALLTGTREETADSVSLMTVHAAKGTEYDAVFIASLVEPVFPSQKALESDSRSGLEEERRLMYVAMTRARKYLTLTWNNDRNYSGTPNRVSRFLAEIPEEYMMSRASRRQKSSSSSSGSKSHNLLEKNILSVRRNGRAASYRPGTQVLHPTFGKGIIIAQEGNRIRVAFDEPYRVQTLNKDFKGLEILGSSRPEKD